VLVQYESEFKLDEHQASNLDNAQTITVQRPYFDRVNRNTVPYKPQTNNLRVIGRTKKYGLFMGSVEPDSFVVEALQDLGGAIPDVLNWTRSGASLKALYQSLSKFDREYTPLPHDKWFNQAVELTFKAFSLSERVDVKPIEEVTIRPDTSAGYSFFLRKKKDVVEQAVAYAKYQSSLARSGKLVSRLLAPDVAFVRTQLAELPNTKTRLVFCRSFEHILREGQFADPLIQEYKRIDSPMFIGKHQLKEVPIFLDNLKLMGNIVGIDWSGFDASLGPGLIKIAFRVLRDNLRLTSEEETEYWGLVDLFLKNPLVMPDGYVYQKKSGVPSGSYFTQLIDSVCNFLLTTYLQLRMFGANYRTKVLGDDSAFAVPEEQEVDMEKMALLAKDVFGMTLNANKSVFARLPSEAEFLGRSSMNGKSARDWMKGVRLAVHTERPSRDPAVSVARVRDLLIDSGYRNPYLHLLYEYMLEKHGRPSLPVGDERFHEFALGSEVPGGIQPEWKYWIRT